MGINALILVLTENIYLFIIPKEMHCHSRQLFQFKTSIPCIGLQHVAQDIIFGNFLLRHQ